MSWKKFSSNNSRKGVIENNSKQKNSIYASKVFTDDIIVNNQIDVGIIDISNLNYTKNTYKSDSINILEFMHGTDISVNSIGVENNVDTSGVVKIIKPIRGYVGLFNKLKGYDTSFEKLNVNAANVKNISSIYDGSKIEIIGNNVNFNDIVDFNDICMNHFNSNTNNEVIISSDISISTQDKSLKIKDVSVNTLESRLSTNIIRFDKDISLNRSIFSIGVSADELILSDISVNVIEAKDISVNITNNIDVNGNINVDKINIDFIGSDVSMQNDLSINTDLCCNTMKIHGNIDKFDNNSLLEFTHTVSFEKTLVKSDMSATTITFNTGSNKVPTNEIIPDNPNNIITYGLNSYRDNSCIVIDGDVSINGKLDAMWDLTGMNIIPTLTSNFDLINNIDDYVIGQFVILKIIGKPEKIFIKSGEKSWHNLVVGNASPFYTKFELNSINSSNNDHIFLDETGNIQDNSFTNLDGLEGTNIIFYVQKIFDLSREIFTLDISHNDPEGDSITSFFDNSYNSYLDGDGWGISLEQASSGFDISRVKILPPINNGFDFSFTVSIQDGIIGIPINQKVTFKKLNQKPDWNYMILSASNSDLLISDQSWNTTSSPSIRDSGDLSNQFYLYFDSCKNYVYSDGIKDLSHYYLDLSALDPEGFDVSYNVSNVKGDLSFGFVDKSRIVIDISDTVISGSDSSLQIISLDDWTDRPNPEERIVKFKHISSQVITGFDLSHNGTSIFREYNINDNNYSYNNLWGHITIEPSYNSIYSTYFGKYDDYSVNSITLSIGNVINDIDIQFKNNQNKKIIDISNSIFDRDISFSFVLNYLFKYNFKLTTLHKPITRAKMIEWVTAFKSNNVSDMSNVTNVYGPIEDWNTSQVTDMSEIFSSTTSFNEDIGGWDTSKVTDMRYMFYNAYDFNQNIGNWNTGNVTDMEKMFNNAYVFDQPIGNWNTENVTDMRYMFYNAYAFNQDISGWDTSEVTNMSYMFSGANFNQPINTSGNKWNTSKVTDMRYMFYYASSFNQPIGNWNTSKVTNMKNMFSSARKFNQPIGDWDTGNVTDMASMFQSASDLSQNISGWNTSKVTNMSYMFDRASSFNQPIDTSGDNWNTSQVTNMKSMFYQASNFNQPIGNWNTSNVTDMNFMFYRASSFNQPIHTNGNKWNTSNVTAMVYMFSYARDFNQNISNWNVENVTDSQGFDNNSNVNWPQSYKPTF